MLNFNEVESEKSYSPIKPGQNVNVKLEKVEITEKGDLDLHFVGTDTDNAGSFKPRFWASNLDSESDKYNEETHENNMKQIKQILEAYLTPIQISKISGQTAAELFNSIKIALTPEVMDVPAVMKIIYKFDSDVQCVIPKYKSFISTDLKPRGLKLRDSLDKNDIPYERVLPLAEYGAVPETGAPTVGFGAGATEEIVPFGQG